MLEKFNEEVSEIDNDFKRIKKRLNKMPNDILEFIDLMRYLKEGSSNMPNEDDGEGETP